MTSVRVLVPIRVIHMGEARAKGPFMITCGIK